MIVQGERRLAGARKAKEQEADVPQFAVRSDHPQDLRSRVKPEAPAPLDPVHRLAEHGFLRFARVVGSQDVRVALVDVEKDQAFRPVRHVDGNEVGLFRRLGREEHAVPHVRDARVVARHVQPAVDGNLRAHSHPTVDLDELHVSERLLNLADGLLRPLPLDRLLHDADRRAVRDDVRVLRGTVLHAGGVHRRTVLARLLSRAGEVAKLLAGEVLQDLPGSDRSRRKDFSGHKVPFRRFSTPGRDDL